MTFPDVDGPPLGRGPSSCLRGTSTRCGTVNRDLAVTISPGAAVTVHPMTARRASLSAVVLTGNADHYASIDHLIT